MIVEHPNAFRRTDLTPEETLETAKRISWEVVIVAGFTTDSDGLVVRTSAMNRKDALWLVEHLKKHVLGELD